MKKIDVITRPEKLVALKKIFMTHNCQGMTVSSVMGCGRQRGYLPYPPPRCRVRRNRQTAVQPFVSAIKLNRFIIGESRRNSIVDRVFENINRNF